MTIGGDHQAGDESVHLGEGVQGHIVTELQREIAYLQKEETLVFSFLHELAELISFDRGSRRVAELIGTGIVRVLNAAGAALYLLDKSGTMLAPQFVTDGCPAIIELPEELKSDPSATGPALMSYLKLKAVAIDGGPIGIAYSGQRPQNLARLSDSVGITDLYTISQAATPTMLAPLNYGSKRLGVLVAVNPPSTAGFPDHVFEIFRHLAEQSAFALGNAMLQQEAMEKRRMEGELRAASEVQRVLLPEKPPGLTGYAIAATYVAARIVSGDYYDFIPVDSSHTGVVIADVSGKGIPASLVMTTCRGLLRGMARGVLSPAEALAGVNRSIYHDMKEDMFVSLAYVMLNQASDSLTLARAGHDAPFLFSKSSAAVRRLDPPGVAMGVDEGDVFERVTKDFSFQMQPGDCLLLYTDGVNEAENSEGDQFGIRRLEEAFLSSAPQGADAVLREIQEAVRLHVGGSPQSDDITLIVIEKK